MFEAAIVLVIGLCVFLVRRVCAALSLRRTAGWIMGGVIVALVVASMLPNLAGPGFNVQAWRPFSTVGYITMTYLPYLAFGLLVVWVVDVIWRKSELRSTSLEVTSAELPATQVWDPSADSATGTQVLESCVTVSEAELRAPSPETGPTLPAKTLTKSLRANTIQYLTIGVMVLAAGVVGYGYWRALTPSINQVEFAHAQVPQAFDGYRVALVTDLHIGPSRGGEWLQQRVDQINAEDVDLVLIVGDLVDGVPAQIGDEMLPILNINARDGVYITTGNHEYYADAQAWVDFWESHGIDVLTNESVVISRDGASIDLVGINDRTGTPPLAADVAEAIATLPSTASDTGRFRLLAAHQPVQALAGDNLASQLGIDLQVSGHTHGGQVWPVHYLAELQQGVLDGVHELGGVTVVTSRGAGAWGPPVRIGAPPEIIVITLRAM
ncbi:MAG: metallophosphoesterase [Propionibacteriaceae bacterium]|jgi:predicted MPP superfamily phosphohydrolase|nr:metallophosphoesterase [Propionibacteriaceae bacterium]